MKSIAIFFYFTKERGNKYVLFNGNGFEKFLEMNEWISGKKDIVNIIQGRKFLMRKGMCNKVVSALLVVSLVLSSSNMSFARTNNQKKLYVDGGKTLQAKIEENHRKEKEYIDKYVEEEKEVIKTYNNLMQSVYNKKTEEYDESYAGSYVNNKGDLVIQVSDSDDMHQYNDIKKNSKQRVSIKKAKHSYNELEDVYSGISKKIEKKNSNKNSILNSISGVEISEEDNKVKVYLEDCSESSISEFKANISNAECIEFEEEEVFVPTAAKSVYSGQKILIGDGYYSMGVRAYYLNSSGKEVKGFLTAGHNVKKGQTVYVCTSSGTFQKVGTVAYAKVGGKVDAAFVKLTNQDYSISKKVYYKAAKDCASASGITLDTDSWWYDIPVGSTVYKAGYKGYCTKGTVKSKKNTISYDLNDDGVIDVTISNMIKATYKTRMGDSGGIVYATDKSPVGIQSGVANSSYDASTGYYSISYCSNIDNILSLNWGSDELYLY